MPHRKPWRVLRVLLITGLGLAALIAAAVVVVLPGVVERLVLAELAAAGIEEAELSVRDVGWASARISDVRIGGGGDLTIDEIAIAYTIPDLLAGRLRRVAISGLGLRASASGEGVSLGALDALLGSLRQGSSGPPLIPVERVELRDTRLELATPVGAVVVTVFADIAVTGGRRVHVEGRVGLRAAWGSANAGLTLDAETDGRLEARLRVDQGELSAAAIRVRGLAGDVALSGTVLALKRIDTRLTAAEVVLPVFAFEDTSIAVTFAADRLSAKAEARASDQQIAFTATATVDHAAGPAPSFVLAVEMAADGPAALGGLPPYLRPTAGRGRARIALSGVVPEAARLTPTIAPRDWLDVVALTGSVDLALEGVAVDGLASGVSAAGRAAIELSDGVLTVSSADGVLLAAAKVDPAVLEALGPGSPFHRFIEGPVTLDIGGPGRAPLTLDVRAEDDALAVHGAAGARLALAAGPVLDAEFDAAAGFDADGAVRRFAVSRLALAVDGLRLGDTALAVESVRLDFAGTPAAFGGGVSMRLAVERAAAPPVAASDARLAIDGDFAFRDDRLSVTVREGGKLRIGGLRIADMFEASGPVEVSLDGAADPALKVELDGAGGVVLRHRLGLAIPALAGSITLPGLGRAAVIAAAPRLRLDGEAHWPGGGYTGTVTARNGGELRISGLRIEDLFEASGPIEARLDGAADPALEVELDGAGGVVLRHRLGLAIPALAGAVTLPGLGRAAVIAAAPRLRLDGEAHWPQGGYTGTVTAADGRLRLPDHGVVLEGIDVTLRAGAREGAEDALVSFSVGALRHEGQPPLVAPLRLDGELGLADGRLSLSGRIGDPDGRLVVEVSGDHDLGRDSGRAALKLHRLAFAPQALQPEDLFPILRGTVSAVSGAVAAEGGIAWTGSELSTDLEVLIDDLSLWSGSVRLQRVNSVVKLDGLWPPSTPPAQLVAVGLLDPGIPLTDGIISFRLAPEGLLDIERAEWRWAGGTIRTGGVTVGPRAAQYDLELEVDDIGLTEIIELADIDGLAATGRLSGLIPVAVSGDGVVIRDGLLEAAPGGGVLGYAPSAVPGALRQAGESVTLMLTAIENFHYESLRITLDRQVDGATEIGLHLRGANPAFFEGYPVEFNLTVSGELDTMLRRGLEGYRVPDAILKRLEGFGS